MKYKIVGPSEANPTPEEINAAIQPLGMRVEQVQDAPNKDDEFGMALLLAAVLGDPVLKHLSLDEVIAHLELAEGDPTAGLMHRAALILRQRQEQKGGAA